MDINEALISLEEVIFTKLTKSGKPYPVHQDILNYLSDISGLTFDKSFIYGTNVMGASFGDSLILNYKGLTIGVLHNWDANVDGLNRFMVLNPLAYKADFLHYGQLSKENDKIIILILELILRLKDINYY